MARTYVYEGAQLISRNGGNLPIGYSMKPEDETYVCETNFVHYSLNLPMMFMQLIK